MELRTFVAPTVQVALPSWMEDVEVVRRQDRYWEFSGGVLGLDPLALHITLIEPRDPALRPESFHDDVDDVVMLPVPGSSVERALRRWSEGATSFRLASFGLPGQVLERAVSVGPNGFVRVELSAPLSLAGDVQELSADIARSVVWTSAPDGADR
ncbi:MAG: hypothetical protein HC923_02385 [Myxococcales bacterium]|nr:hypothetical protein [Myxococcales bacterium]